METEAWKLNTILNDLEHARKTIEGAELMETVVIRNVKKYRRGQRSHTLT